MTTCLALWRKEKNHLIWTCERSGKNHPARLEGERWRGKHKKWWEHLVIDKAVFCRFTVQLKPRWWVIVRESSVVSLPSLLLWVMRLMIKFTCARFWQMLKPFQENLPTNFCDKDEKLRGQWPFYSAKLSKCQPI